MSSRLMRIGALIGIAAFLTVTIASAQHRAADGPAGSEDRGVAVFNPVEGRITVLSSRPDGSRVEKGEVVCELDPADLNDRIASQETEVHSVRAGAQGARLAREAAAMELNEYKDGRYAQELTTVEGEIKLAETNLVKAEDDLEWGRRMFAKGYMSMAEKLARELAFKKDQFALEQVQARKVVLVKRSRERTNRDADGRGRDGPRARTGQAGRAPAGRVDPQEAARSDRRMQGRGPRRRPGAV